MLTRPSRHVIFEISGAYPAMVLAWGFPMIGRVLDPCELQTTENHVHLARDWAEHFAAATEELIRDGNLTGHVGQETFKLECPVWKRETERPFNILAYLRCLRV